MSVKILTDQDKGYQCLYCSSTMTAFGPIFYTEQDEDAKEFLEWLSPLDARSMSQGELDNKKYEWLAAKEMAESEE